MADHTRIAVLGAGPMGLAVAYELALQGQRPVVFEADDRLGGMAAGFDFGPLRIERYYHFHCTSDHAFLELLGELGIAERMRWRATTMAYFIDNRLHDWGNPLALLRFSPLSLVARVRCGLHAFMCIRRNRWDDLDDVEATGWVRRWVGAEAYERLWRRLFEHKFHQYTPELSAAWIWSRIRRIGRSRESLMRERLGYLEGGSDTLLDALRAAIEQRGGEVRLAHPVERVVVADGRVQGVRVNGQHHAFDTVVSTVPLPYVPRLMPDLPEDTLAKLRAQRNIAVVCVIARLKRPLTPHFWVNIVDDEMDIPGLVEYTNLRPMAEHVVYVPFYLPGEHPKYAEPDEAFTSRVRGYFKRIDPTLSDADILDVRASRYRHAQPICGPGHLCTLPPARTAIDGLWAADTSYYYPEDRGISESIAFGRRMARDALGLPGAAS